MVVMLLQLFQFFHFLFQNMRHKIAIRLRGFNLFYFFANLVLRLTITLLLLSIAILHHLWLKNSFLLVVEFDLDIVNSLVEEIDISERF